VAINTPPCKMHTVYIWRALQGGACGSSDMLVVVSTQAARQRQPWRWRQWHDLSEVGNLPVRYTLYMCDVSYRGGCPQGGLGRDALTDTSVYQLRDINFGTIILN
jgi:hypothetical protein